ncbi:MAG: efflux transporter outer membrane subunit [Rhizobacter sp.]
MAALVLAGCVNLAPSDDLPQAPLPGSWPVGAPASAPAVFPSTAVRAEDIAWREFFTDARLRAVIEATLANNRDLRVAIANIELMRARYGLQRGERFPSVEAIASGSRARTSGTLQPRNNTNPDDANNNSSGQARITNQYRADLGFSNYEIDLFGRVRHLDEAALKRFFSVAENRRSTQISLVAEVANAWLTLAADIDRLRLAQDTLASRLRSHELMRRTHELGGASGLALAQAQTNVDAARVAVAAGESQVALDRNALDLLAGTSVADALLPAAAAGSTTRAGEGAASLLLDIPAGLPSALLQRRPDVRAAEFTLQAANADIGAARAAFYPSISLTANAGFASGSLSDLFNRASGVWSFVPQISIPIFDGGARRAGLQGAEAQRDIDLAGYEKALQTAFREVADVLAQRRTLGERLAAQRSQVDATARVLALSEAIFRNGASGYLDVLDAQRTLYAARQDEISLRLAEQVNRVTLYKVLGGGYGAPDETTEATVAR